jgi:hypothetical protein
MSGTCCISPRDIWTSGQYRVLPRAEDLLGRLAESGVMLRLVSGGMEGAARTKLTPANLNRFFVSVPTVRTRPIVLS